MLWAILPCFFCDIFFVMCVREEVGGGEGEGGGGERGRGDLQKRIGMHSEGDRGVRRYVIFSEGSKKKKASRAFLSLALFFLPPPPVTEG